MNIEVLDANFLVHQKLHMIGVLKSISIVTLNDKGLSVTASDVSRASSYPGESIEFDSRTRLELDTELKIFTEKRQSSMLKFGSQMAACGQMSK